MSNFWQALTRRKHNDGKETESGLARCLTLFDLTLLGVGSTLGLGTYILAGSVAFEHAGPAVTISLLIDAIASAFAGLCFAEFAARVPKAGSAYVYSYVSVGEFVAFTVGWNLILEYVIGTSSYARGLSGYLDALMDNAMTKALRQIMPIDISFLGTYSDFFSFILVLAVVLILAVGVKGSSVLHNIFTGLNLLTVLVVLVTGSIKADPANWKIAKEDIPEGIHGGEGGFMPFGVPGIMLGAAKCFYGFVGFDCLGTTGEEAKNPKRDIPLSIGISLIIIFLIYFGVSTVITMMSPYWDQDPNAPFPYVYGKIGWIEIKWIVAAGDVSALCANMLGAMFPLPRVLYAMANDGVIFSGLKKVHPKTKTPVIATILSGLLAALMALFFDLQQLLDMMSISTLLAYTVVAVCVLNLRYHDDNINISEVNPKLSVVLKQLINFNSIKHTNNLTSIITKFGVIIYFILAIILCVILQEATIDIKQPIGIILLVIVGAGIVLTILVISRQPVADIELSFKVPLVPLLPCLSILINLYLMFLFDMLTWIRYLVWIIIGYVIYFGYGIRHSTEGKYLSKDISDIKISTITA